MCLKSQLVNTSRHVHDISDVILTKGQLWKRSEYLEVDKKTNQTE